MTSKFEVLQIIVTAALILSLAVAAIWGKIIMMKMGVFTSDLHGLIRVLIVY